MNYRNVTLLTAAATVLLVAGCGKTAAPTDSAGESPDGVLLKTYRLIAEGKYAEAERNFSPPYLDEFVSSKGKDFETFCKETTKGWRPEWLKAEVVGNDYNPDIWRVKIIPDEGKGADNRPGVVQDLIIIDGSWKVVFWGHYPKR